MTNARKPSYFLIAPHAYNEDPTTDWIADDVYECDTTHHRRFANESPLVYHSLMLPCDLYIHRSRTNRLADPIDWFSEVLLRMTRSTVYIELNPSRASTTRRFPQVDVRWNAVRVKFSPTAVGVRRGLADAVLTHVELERGEPFLDVTSRVFERELALLGFAWGTLVVYGDNDDEACPKVRATVDRVEALIGRVHDGATVRVNSTAQPVCAHVFGRAYDVLKAAMPHLSGVAAHVHLFPPGHGPQTRSGQAIAIDLSAEPQTYKGYQTSWPYFHRWLYGYASALEPLGLPQYVLLEILDWLPKMERQPQYKKVAVIERVLSCIRRVRQARQPSAIKEQRTS